MPGGLHANLLAEFATKLESNGFEQVAHNAGAQVISINSEPRLVGSLDAGTC
jgi:hypothetical protein